MIRRCIPKNEILTNHEVGGHFGASKRIAKVWQSSFHWPDMYKDAKVMRI